LIAMWKIASVLFVTADGISNGRCVARSIPIVGNPQPAEFLGIPRECPQFYSRFVNSNRVPAGCRGRRNIRIMKLQQDEFVWT
jgi:hypothetical protein